MNIDTKLNNITTYDNKPLHECKIKVEIIDNQISNCWELNYYTFRKVNKWYESTNYDWVKEWHHIMGKKYMCPAIFNKKTTAHEMFNKEVERVLDVEDIIQVHRVVITKN